MQLTHDVTFEKIEQLARQIGDDKAEALQVPLKIKNAGAGGEVALIQLLLSWATQQPTPDLRFWRHGAALSTEEHFSLLERVYGVVASLISHRFSDGKGELLSLKVFRERAVARLDDLVSASPQAPLKGPMWATLCADDFNKSAPPLLYSGHATGNPTLRDRLQFYSVVASLLAKTFPANIGSERKSLQRFVEDDVKIIASMIYEVFRNTEDHALFDTAGARVRKSVRGVFAQNHARPPQEMEAMAGSFTPFAAFCRDLPLWDDGLQRAGQQTNLLEISTFDAGGGFAETFLRRPLQTITPAEELDAVQTCFRKNQTSKDRSGFGQGLTRVLRLMSDKEGFLRLRTGRLCLYLDLRKADWPAPDVTPALNVWPGDVQLAPLRGSVISLFIPLRLRT